MDRLTIYKPMRRVITKVPLGVNAGSWNKQPYFIPAREWKRYLLLLLPLTSPFTEVGCAEEAIETVIAALLFICWSCW